MPEIFDPIYNSHFECSDVELSSLRNQFVKAIIKKEEELVIKLLTEYLGREPKLEDYKRCTKIYHPGEPINYDFAFDDVTLGYVRYEIYGPKTTITFTPHA